MKKVKKIYNNIVLVDSIYSLLIFLLYSGDDKDNLYIVSTRIDKKILSKLKGDKIIYNHDYSVKTYFENCVIKKILRVIHLKLYIRYKVPSLSKFKYKKIYAQDITYFSKVLLKNYKYTLIEDGYGNYEDIMYNENKNQLIKRILFRSIKGWGLSNNCEKIILTGIGKVPSIIKNKVELIDLKELWKKDNIKENILRIYNLNHDLISKIRERNTILITQPFSELRIISEEDKINIYKNCVPDQYDDLVIKTHPDEITNYEKYFEGALIINQAFPFEILDLLEIKFKKIITLFSTAALSLKTDSKLIWCGSEVHPKLFKKYGPQPMV